CAPGPACTPRRTLIPHRQLPPETRRARHPGAGRGRALAASDAHPQAPVAVVARTGPTRSGRPVAGLRCDEKVAEVERWYHPTRPSFGPDPISCVRWEQSWGAEPRETSQVWITPHPLSHGCPSSG